MSDNLCFEAFVVKIFTPSGVPSPTFLPLSEERENPPLRSIPPFVLTPWLELLTRAMIIGMLLLDCKKVISFLLYFQSPQKYHP